LEHSLDIAQTFLSAVAYGEHVLGLQHIELVGLKQKLHRGYTSVNN